MSNARNASIIKFDAPYGVTLQGRSLPKPR